MQMTMCACCIKQQRAHRVHICCATTNGAKSFEWAKRTRNEVTTSNTKTQTPLHLQVACRLHAFGWCIKQQHECVVSPVAKHTLNNATSHMLNANGAVCERRRRCWTWTLYDEINKQWRHLRAIRLQRSVSRVRRAHISCTELRRKEELLDRTQRQCHQINAFKNGQQFAKICVQ